MFNLIIAVRGTVDDETEALSVKEAVSTALIPFAELNLKTTASITQQVPPAPVEPPP